MVNKDPLLQSGNANNSTGVQNDRVGVSDNVGRAKVNVEGFILCGNLNCILFISFLLVYWE